MAKTPEDEEPGFNVDLLKPKGDLQSIDPRWTVRSRPTIFGGNQDRGRGRVGCSLWRLGEPLEIIHAPLQIERSLVFEDIEGLDAYGLRNIQLGIVRRDSLRHEAIECFLCCGRNSPD